MTTCQIYTGNHHLNSDSSAPFFKRCCLSDVSCMSFLFDKKLNTRFNCFSLTYSGIFLVSNSAGMWSCFDRQQVTNDGNRWKQLAVMHGRPRQAYHGSPLNPLSCVNYARYSTERKILNFAVNLLIRSSSKITIIKCPEGLFVTFRWQVARWAGVLEWRYQLSKDRRTASARAPGGRTRRHLTADHATMQHVNFVKTRK